MKRAYTTLILLVVLLFGTAFAQSDGRIVIAQGTDAASLDPQLQNDAFTTSILSNIFDTLVYRTADTQLAPGLATSWESISDTQWQFELRAGVVFQNGDTFDAEDVKFTLERPLDEDLGSPLSSRFAVIDRVEIVDADTVIVHTVNPYPLLPARLSEWFMLSMEYTTANDIETLSSQPVGTGAYAFVEWVKDDHLTLTRFEDHWRGAPEIAEVVFRPIPEISTRVAALQAGDADLITNVPAFRQDDLESASGLEIRGVPSTYIQYVALDGTKDEALADVRVRQAIQYATNVDEIIEFLFNGAAARIAVPLAFGTFGLDESIEPYPYDPERARELLAEAGYPDGITFTLDAPVGRYAQDKEVAEALVGQWAQVGINVELNINEWSVQLTKYREDQSTGGFEGAHFMGWGTSTFDADDIMYGGFVRGGQTKNNYSDEQVSQLVTAARTSLDSEEREELYSEALRIIHEQVPWLFLFQQFDIYGVRADIDWQPRQDQKIEVRTMSIR